MLNTEQNQAQGLDDSLIHLSNLEIEDYQLRYHVNRVRAIQELSVAGFPLSPEQLLAEIEEAEQAVELGKDLDGITL